MSNTKHRPGSEWLGDLAVWLVDNAETNDAQMTRLRRNLRIAQQDLTPRQRQVVELYYSQGMPLHAIARELGVTTSSVSRTLKRARHTLYRCLRYGL